MTTDPIVTYEDLPMLRSLREHGHGGDRMAAIVDALIAAAEADAPPLPKDHAPAWWAEQFAPLAPSEAIGQAIGAGSMCWADIDRAGVFQSTRAAAIADGLLRALTPLRPTITEADFMEALDAFLAASEGMSTKGSLRAAFEAAGVVIEP